MNNNVQSNFARPRIVLLDALRGYALMGLFLIHMVEYFELYWYHPEPGPINTVMFALFGGKAYGMFALLFGVSFFIIMDNQAKKGVDFRLRFLWRLSLLLIMGYVHGLVYSGDILQVLAVTGVFLVPLYRFSNRALLLVALFFVLQIPSLVVYFVVNVCANYDYHQPIHWSMHPSIFKIYATGSYIDVLITNIWQGQVGKWVFMFESGRLWNIAGLSVLGFLLGRIGFFTNLVRYRRAYLWSIVLATVSAIMLILFEKEVLLLVSETEAKWIFANTYTAWLNHTFILITVIALTLLFQIRGLSRIIGILAPCGRITLTLYVMHSMLFVPLFYGYGAGAFAYIGQPISLVLAIIFWGMQVWLARVWIQHYYYGPLEWFWRSATWMQADVPFKRYCSH